MVPSIAIFDVIYYQISNFIIIRMDVDLLFNFIVNISNLCVGCEM